MSGLAGPIITATATIIGVLVGGLLTGAVQYYRERKREEHLGRIAARVVAADLTDTAAVLAAVVRTETLVAQQVPAPLSSWDTYREVLAARLPAATWTKVHAATALIGALSRELPPLAPGGAPARPPGGTLARITQAVEVLTDAAAALAHSGPAR